MNKGVIFDLDGVLLDYSYRFHKTYEDVLGEIGISCPSRDRLMEIRKMCSNSQVEVLDRFLVPKDIPNRSQVIQTCAQKRESTIEDPQYLYLDRFFEDALDVAADLHDRRGYRTAVITKRKNRELLFQQLKEHLALFDFVETTFKKEDAIKKFMADFKLSACYFLTDTAHDVIAGKNTGIVVVGVLSGLENETSLKAAGADYIINSAKDIYSILK